MQLPRMRYARRGRPRQVRNTPASGAAGNRSRARHGDAAGLWRQVASSEQGFPEKQSAVRRVPSQRDTENRNRRRSCRPAQRRRHPLLGSVELAVAMQIVPLAGDGRVGRQVRIDAMSYDHISMGMAGVNVWEHNR